MKPMDIEVESMRIIRRELGRDLPPDIQDVVLRAIHATADFSFADTLRFTPGVVARIRAMLREGALLLTDTQMALWGISQAACDSLGVKKICLMADPQVAREAAARGVTRAQVSMERGLRLPGPKVLVCGNAPTFLKSAIAQRPQDCAFIGVPVGFVNVCQAKDALWQSGLPCIVNLGRRGGSPVAAAIVNALLYGIQGVRPCG